MQMLLVINFIILIVGIGAANEFKLVKTNSGFVRGKMVPALLNDKPYVAFKGIPYAEAPIGNLRFKVNL